MSESRALYEDEYCAVRLEPSFRLVTYVRTALRYPDVAVGEASFGKFATLDFGGAERLLMDMREVPGDNTAKFESIIDTVARRTLFKRFSRVAAVVRTVVGKLQIGRIASTAPTDVFRVFQDETEARKWLLTTGSTSHPPRA